MRRPIDMSVARAAGALATSTALTTEPGRITGTPGQTVFGEALDTLDTPSADNKAMLEYWTMVNDIVDGAEAMRARHDKYLPKFPNETATDYKFRWENSKFTNVYRDIIENLSSKPFEQEVSLVDDDAKPKPGEATPEGGANKPPAEILSFIEDVDGTGCNLTVFSADTFFSGINNALDWILVDFPTVIDEPGRPRTVAEEKAMGIRPFWVHIMAANVLDVRSRVVNGKERLIYMKIQEWEPDGKYIRIMRADDVTAAWELYKEDPTRTVENGQVHKYHFEASGSITIGEIPMRPFATGRRKGRSWRFNPPMQDAASLQIELYQQESGLKNIETLAGFPMLTGEGVKPEYEGTGQNKKAKTLATGPNAVLYGGSDGQTVGKWNFIAPPADIMKFLLEHINETVKQLRELGRNPLTAQSAGVTVINSMVAAKKGNSAVQMWGLNLKNTLEEALMLTAKWMKVSYDPQVNVYTDFDVDGAESDIDALMTARRDRNISLETFWKEMMRRGVLSAEFDPDDEAAKLLVEGIDEQEAEDEDTPAPAK